MLLGLGSFSGCKGGSTCKKCLGEMSCKECQEIGACSADGRGSHGRRFYGFSGITDGVSDAIGSITSCGYMPILAGFAAGYLAKKMRWI